MKEKYNMLHLTAYALGSYDSCIPVPANLTLKDAVDYAKSHSEDIPLSDMTYIPGSDMLDEFDDNPDNYDLQPLPDDFDPTTYTPTDKTQSLDTNDKGELLGNLIDIFEDFFTEKGLDEYLHKELQAKMKQPDNNAKNNNVVFQGDDYNNLQTKLEDTLKAWHLLP